MLFASVGFDFDAQKETPCKNATETNPNNVNFEDLDHDGNFYIFLGNI